MKKNGIFSFVGTLKQIKDGYSVAGKTISGIIRLECEDGITTVFSSFINFKTLILEEYKLFIVNSKKQIKTIDLNSRPISQTKTFEDFTLDEGGFTAGVCVIENEVPLLIAVSKTENFTVDVLEFKKLIYEKYACIHKNKAKKDAKNITTINGEFFKPNTTVVEYDDEVVATENYYSKNYTPNIVVGEKNYEDLPNENVEVDLPNEKKEEETKENGNSVKNENDTRSKETCRDSLTYYERTKGELDEIFSRFPKEENLVKIFPESKWCKVYYEEEKYYVVGLIKENEREKYICYGVYGEYSTTPPKELKGYCCFIPLSIFDLTGSGYWMMFQDAVTGASIKKMQN